jgi:uncharacterized protein YggT (Ycf19 family)
MEREESHIVREEPGPGPVEPGGRTIRDESYVREPAASSAETEVVSRWSPSRQAFDLIYLVFAVIDGLILIRILLKVLAANTAVPFTGFVYGVTNWLLAPFHGLLPVLVSGRSVFEMSALIGLLVYSLLGYVLSRFFAIMFRRDVTVAQNSRTRGFRPRSG